jgi:hypothetical protein
MVSERSSHCHTYPSYGNIIIKIAVSLLGVTSCNCSGLLQKTKQNKLRPTISFLLENRNASSKPMNFTIEPFSITRLWAHLLLIFRY